MYFSYVGSDNVSWGADRRELLRKRRRWMVDGIKWILNEDEEDEGVRLTSWNYVQEREEVLFIF